MNNIIHTILEKLQGNLEATLNHYDRGYSIRFKADDPAVFKLLLADAVTKTCQAEIKELETMEGKRREWETQNSIAKAELARDRKLMELDLATKRGLLAQAIKVETDEEKRALMQTAVENVALKEKIAYLEGELSFYRNMARESSSAVNETLKTAFTNQPAVTINTK